MPRPAGPHGGLSSISSESQTVSSPAPVGKMESGGKRRLRQQQREPRKRFSMPLEFRIDASPSGAGSEVDAHSSSGSTTSEEPSRNRMPQWSLGSTQWSLGSVHHEATHCKPCLFTRSRGRLQKRDIVRLLPLARQAQEEAAARRCEGKRHRCRKLSGRLKGRIDLDSVVAVEAPWPSAETDGSLKAKLVTQAAPSLADGQGAARLDLTRRRSGGRPWRATRAATGAAATAAAAAAAVAAAGAAAAASLFRIIGPTIGLSAFTSTGGALATQRRHFALTLALPSGVAGQNHCPQKRFELRRRLHDHEVLGSAFGRQA